LPISKVDTSANKEITAFSSGVQHLFARRAAAAKKIANSTHEPEH
jgi:hypothetical protein